MHSIREISNRFLLITVLFMLCLGGVIFHSKNSKAYSEILPEINVYGNNVQLLWNDLIGEDYFENDGYYIIYSVEKKSSNPKCIRIEKNSIDKVWGRKQSWFGHRHNGYGDYEELGKKVYKPEKLSSYWISNLKYNQKYQFVLIPYKSVEGNDYCLNGYDEYGNQEMVVFDLYSYMNASDSLYGSSAKTESKWKYSSQEVKNEKKAYNKIKKYANKLGYKVSFAERNDYSISSPSGSSEQKGSTVSIWNDNYIFMVRFDARVFSKKEQWTYYNFEVTDNKGFFVIEAEHIMSEPTSVEGKSTNLLFPNLRKYSVGSKECHLNTRFVRMRQGEKIRLKLLNNKRKVKWELEDDGEDKDDHIGLSKKTKNGVTVKARKKGRCEFYCKVGKERYVIYVYIKKKKFKGFTTTDLFSGKIPTESSGVDDVFSVKSELFENDTECVVSVLDAIARNNDEDDSGDISIEFTLSISGNTSKYESVSIYGKGSVPEKDIIAGVDEGTYLIDKPIHVSAYGNKYEDSEGRWFLLVFNEPDGESYDCAILHITW